MFPHQGYFAFTLEEVVGAIRAAVAAVADDAGAVIITMLRV